MYRLFWLILLLYSTGLRAQPVHLYGKSYRDKYRYIDSLEQGRLRKGGNKMTTPDRKLILQWAEDSKDPELRCMLLLAAYRHRAGIAGQDTAAMEKELEDMLDEYSDNRYLRADILQSLGKFYL
ncbi:MAG TPA: hypothetical protein VEB40_01770, partial [Flavipsychrobacter sp.]|nr:hypothetical protein [Flavipsychrobacter sp.]